MIVLFGLPVNATLKFAFPPIQIGAVPEMVAVGFGFTVTIAVPVKLVPTQFTSETAVKEYVVVALGETEIKYGLAVIPEIVTGVVPSV